jgi:hypothetical protein
MIFHSLSIAAKRIIPEKTTIVIPTTAKAKMTRTVWGERIEFLADLDRG